MASTRSIDVPVTVRLEVEVDFQYQAYHETGRHATGRISSPCSWRFGLLVMQKRRSQLKNGNERNLWESSIYTRWSA